MTKYILFCGQEGNFQTRSMLIPVDLLPPHRLLDFEVLRKHAEPMVVNSTVFTNTLTNEKAGVEGSVTIEQVLFQNIIWKGDIGHHEETLYDGICSDLISFADWGDEMCDDKDREWLSSSIYNVCSSGFNHITNYLSMRHATSYKGTPIEVVEGFLVLVKDDGVWSPPPVNTVEEMFETYYGIKIPSDVSEN